MNKPSSYDTKRIRHNQYIVLVVILILAYLILGTGLHGDDNTVIHSMQNYGILDFFSFDPSKMGLSIFGLINYYLFWWAYPVFEYEFQLPYDVIKIVAHTISVYFVYKFFIDYFPKDRAILVAFIFVLYPLHETTTYWYMTTPYVFWPSVILFSHYLIRNNMIIYGVLALLLGSFSFYASPPYIFGLAVIFFLENKFKKAIIFFIPGLLYVVYYFWIKFNYVGVERRINADLGTLDFLKQMLIQPLSFLESAIGPSYWLKAFYAIESISLVSVIIASVISIFVFLKVQKISKTLVFPKSLLIGLISVLVLSFGMYALTGLYAHSAFNLGNRSTVYGSLFVAFLLVALLPANKKSAVFLLIIFLVPVFGLSDHWKSWNSHQKIAIKNIKNNQDLKEIEPDSTLIVTGNIYSKLGPFAHIEFFSMPWNVNAIFQDSVKTKNIVALTPYVKIEGDYIIDPKFGGKYSLSNKLYVYESENNLVRSISFIDVPDLIKQQPKIIRHWVQLFKDTWIQKIIVNLSPRLIYLFQ